MHEQVAADVSRPTPSGRASTWFGLLAVGIALALVAQFWLDAFADSSTLGHWTQHAALFLAGAMVGVGILRLYQLGSRAD